MPLYALKSGSGMIPLDTDKWTYSKESNNLFHDIDHAGDVNHDVILDARIPMYFTVPPNTEGEHRRYNVHADSRDSTGSIGPGF